MDAGDESRTMISAPMPRVRRDESSTKPRLSPTSVNMRVTGTAILADYQTAFAMGFYHSFSGWLVFVAGFGLLYLSARAIHALLERERAS